MNNSGSAVAGEMVRCIEKQCRFTNCNFLHISRASYVDFKVVVAY